MDTIFYYTVTPKGQPGNQLLFSRFAIRNSRRPLKTLKAYIKKQRTEEGRFQTPVYIQLSKAESAPYEPEFESDNAKVFEYPVENGTGLLEE